MTFCLLQRCHDLFSPPIPDHNNSPSLFTSTTQCIDTYPKSVQCESTELSKRTPNLRSFHFSPSFARPEVRSRKPHSFHRLRPVRCRFARVPQTSLATSLHFILCCCCCVPRAVHMYTQWNRSFATKHAHIKRWSFIRLRVLYK